jgi:hypothetical protein
MTGTEQQREGDDAELAQLQRALSTIYKVERLLIRRGTSLIYQAEEVNPPRPVALRIFPPEMGLGPVAAGFKEAAQQAVRLNHPNVVPLYRIGMRAGAPFFVAMKLVDGRTLQEIVEAQGALHIPIIVAVLRAVAAGLAYAHGRGTVHGALSTATVLVDRNGHVAVAEFATARVVEDGAATAAGKLRPRTPEEAAGGAAGAAGDQYAFGMIALEMLTGSPHAATDPLAADPLASLHEVRAARVAIPDALLRVIETALARDPTERFASLAHLDSAIQAIPFSDADGREASVVLGRLARGEQATKVRAAAASPKPPAGAEAGAAGPRASGPSAAATEVRPRVVVPTPPPQPPAAAPPPPVEPAPAAPRAPAAHATPTPRPAATPPAPPPPPAPPVAAAKAPAAEPAPEPVEEESPAPVPAAEAPAPARPVKEAAATAPAPRVMMPEKAGEGPSRRSRLPLAIGAVVIVAALGAGAYLLLGRRPAASPPPAMPAAAPAPAETVAAAPAAAVAESARADSVRRAATAADSARLDSLRAAARPGELAFNVVPTSATIYIDGKVSGGGGIVDSEVAPGPRHVSVSAPGFTTFDTTVTVRPNTPLDLGEIVLRAAEGRADSTRTTALLRLTTVPPTAQIFVEGQPVGTGSLTDFQLSPGRWHLRITAPGYATFDTVIAVTAGAHVRLGEITLKSGGGP